MKQPWKFVAGILGYLCALLFVVAVCDAQNQRAEIGKWQEAARPAAVRRGLVGDNMTPEYLEGVLCEKCAATHYEHAKLYVYGNHAHHKR